MFELSSSYTPKGDQPQAIKQIIDGFNSNQNKITLLGATGTGKTFTMANIINQYKKPTLIISHNKTLCAQLATEFKYFFPKNAVHYFVSYFDYYQPEAYIASRDTYIEKESTINQEIEMFRLGTMASLLSREDVIVVASVSALYGLGSKSTFEKNSLNMKVGNKYDFDKLKRKLIEMQYKPLQSNVKAGIFDFKGEMLDVYSSFDKQIYRFIFDYDILQLIQIKDITTFKEVGTSNNVTIWPANQFIQEMGNLENIIKEIKEEMEFRVAELKQKGKELEANRLEKRVIYDIRMIKETGFVNGIENYSRYFDGRDIGEPPNTLFDYFPDDMLLIIDESHMTLPQLKAMPSGDYSRKKSLVEYGFRLPSALDHRPLNFDELKMTLLWEKIEDIVKTSNYNINHIKNKIKKNSKSLFVSATPSNYELMISEQIVEQIIRPTGLLDPTTYVYPKSGDYNILLNSLKSLQNKNPEISNYFDGYEDKAKVKDIFN